MQIDAPATLALRRHQQMANHSPQTLQSARQAAILKPGRITMLQRFQQMADESPQTLVLKRQAEMIQAKSVPSHAAPVAQAEKPDHAGLPTQLKSGIASLSAPASTALDAGVIQRVVRIDHANVLPQHHAALISEVRRVIEFEELFWTDAMAATLNAWLTSRDTVVEAPSAQVIAYNLYHHGTAADAWVDMTRGSLTPEQLGKAALRRHRARFAGTMAPHATQVTKRVPGLSKLANRQLLRLGETGKEEREFWVRQSALKKPRLMTAKRKDISAADEAHITAAGLADDPSYTVQSGNHQLGHRYRGTGQQFIVGAKHARTYGSKKEREGYEYKGSGLVDGHSVQVQDDQPILGPFQQDAPDWSTTIAKTDGTSVTYADTAYLPKDGKDERWMETMPHNFYWENQEQGKHMRQKTLETPAMNDGTSFLHYNHYTGDTFHPNAGSATAHSYDIPSRIDYLTTDAAQTDVHYHVDNMPTADYSRPSEYDPLTHRYASVPGGVPMHKLNKSLGGESATLHRDRARMPDTKSFPFATVLQPDADDFSFKPDWRTELSGYETPPGTPYYDEGAMDESMMVETGDQSHLHHFEHGDGVVAGAEFDEVDDKTTLKISSMKKSEPSDWNDNAAFTKLAGTALPELPPAAATTPAAVSSAPKGAATASAPSPQLVAYQHQWLRLHAAVAELIQSTETAAQPPLHDLEKKLMALGTHAPAQLAALNLLQQELLAWFALNAGKVQRQLVGGTAHEKANHALAGHGQRLPALRQFFNECGQMAAYNALAMPGNGALAANDNGTASSIGGFEQDIDENAIRELIRTIRPELPVLGRLDQVKELVTLLADDDHGALDDKNISYVERIGLAQINAFKTGATATLTVVVNTRSHRQDGGTHWIAAQLVRQADGQIQVRYQDSFDQAKNYTHLFTALRNYFNHIPANP